ncbi:MAG: Nicotinate-nucleotide adenylyltransferase [Elusimicrobia bacterium]|nr:Nicotinate-nucleotide adenylyltransferase [Elusimicrobiota bacterium]
MKRRQKIGLLGGTFDPVHQGHLALAKAALKQLELDLVYLVLSPRSPFKLDHNLTPVQLRAAMLKLALKDQEKIQLGEWEINRPGPSYSVTTLSTYKKMNPTHDLFLILGSDALASFSKWKSHNHILRLATLVVGRRPGTSLEMSGVIGQIFFLKGMFPEISSSRIRQDLATHKKPQGLPVTVERFIRAHQLYGKK